MMPINSDRIQRYRILAAVLMCLLLIFASPGSTAGNGTRGNSIAADDKHPAPLPIGSPTPEFRLPGTDGRMHSLDEFKGAKALVIVFTAIHCPTAEVYEGRLKKLVTEF